MRKRNRLNMFFIAAAAGIIFFPLIGCVQSSGNKNPADTSGSASGVSDSLYIQNNDSSQSRMGDGGMMGRRGMHNGMMGGGMMMNGGSTGTIPKGTWKAPSSAEDIKNPLAGIVEATQKGENIFNQYCVPCHGNGGKGNGPTAATLSQKPANLTSERVQSQTDGDIFWKMSNGRGAMAAYKNILTEKQRWELVDYIRLLGKQG